ncbi:DUF5632 domain-containing protein [Mycolicibacillus parakoreensis]|uniref:DUF5632 domain-containing protein n=2 Tax=Mycobacteriaceae TaxID=1762 RepID=A0ABY3UAP4_9MYCO|nr:DUF5632 domain-containing protein [Mycolicibacillus parakoreensis]MCV7316209.1 DUF5632 domain-containing protein [Mycolicibacillus parakoreensis]ULN54798.2 DUF5632 domain-containing protein [Mycolicibacillus parakoreensis]
MPPRDQPGQLAAAAQHWEDQRDQRLHEAARTNSTIRMLAVNEGRTAEHVIGSYQRTAVLLRRLADKADTKAAELRRVSDAATALISRLDGIAADGYDEIEHIQSSSADPITKQVAIAAVAARCHADAARASTEAVAMVEAATTRVLEAQGSALTARAALADHGGIVAAEPPPELPAAVPDVRGADTRGHGEGAGAEPPAGPAPVIPDVRQPATSEAGPGDAGAPPHIPVAGALSPATPAVPGVAPAPPPAAALGQALSPDSLGQAFVSGAAAGQGVAPGANALTAGTLHAAEAGSAPQPPPPVAPQPVAPGPPTPVPAVDAGPHTASPGTSLVPPVVDAPAAPAHPVMPVIAAGPPSAAAPPMAAAGPLPAYGSDLRPPVVAPPPPAAAAPAGPVGGTPVAPASAAGAPAGSLVSPVAKTAPPSSVAGAAAPATAGATAGAAAGALGGQVEEKARLQRIVDAVARQERGVAWAAGVRADGATLLTTDVACGWIPPHVRLPAGVVVLAPAVRRTDMTAVDLLGSVKVAAAHSAGYVPPPAADAPALTGDHRARATAELDELVPELVGLATRCGGLRRLVVTAARHGGRGGLAADERPLLAAYTAEYARDVLDGYPRPDPLAVGRWMITAAAEALVNGDRAAANYHTRWAKEILR